MEKGLYITLKIQQHPEINNSQSLQDNKNKTHILYFLLMMTTLTKGSVILIVGQDFVEKEGFLSWILKKVVDVGYA